MIFLKLPYETEKKMGIYCLTMGWDRLEKRIILSKCTYFLNFIILRQFHLKLNNKNLKVVLKHGGGGGGKNLQIENHMLS